MPARKIFVAGHNGMVGAAIVRLLKSDKNVELVLRERKDLDLTNQSQVDKFFESQDFDEVYLAAAKVGGIQANNNCPADFIYENLIIECNVIKSSFVHGVSKLLFLGSSCIYPKLAAQPISENSLLTGALEPTNEPYAIAKIAGIKLCESFNRQHSCDFRSIMPTNLYGPKDNFHLENSHVIPALLSKVHFAKTHKSKEVSVWGSGKPMREFLYVDDLASASVHVMNLNKGGYADIVSPMQSHINVGSGLDCTISELAETIADVIGFDGNIVFDSTKPDGAPRKLLNISLIQSTGWIPKFRLKEGLEKTYRWYLKNYDSVKV